MLFLLQQLSSEHQPPRTLKLPATSFPSISNCPVSRSFSQHPVILTQHLKSELLFSLSFMSVNISRTVNVLHPIWLAGFVYFHFLGFQASSGFFSSSLPLLVTAFIATCFLNAYKKFCDFSCTLFLFSYSSKLKKLIVIEYKHMIIRVYGKIFL